MIPETTVSKQEVENWNATLCLQFQEERKSIDVYQLLSEDKIRVHIEAEESSTNDDDDDIIDNKLNTLSSYKDIKFNDGNISEGTSRCSTPDSDILCYPSNQEKLLKDVEGKPRSSTLDSALKPKGNPITINSTRSLERNQLRGRFYRSPSPCLLYTSPSPRDRTRSRMPSSA